MKTLRQIIKEAEQSRTAIGHFNISECVALKGIFKAAQELNLPVIIGLSEGEQNFFGTKNAALIIKNLRQEFNWPIFINSDHTKSLEKIKEAVEAGFDSVHFDGGKLPFEENIKKTKEVVEYAKSINPNILVEAELGYLGASSMILKEIPKGAAIKEEDLTKPEQAAQFVKETGVDLLAPAVGNIHGMFKNAPNPHIDLARIGKIKELAGVPLVLHGGSGIRDEEFIKAIDAGISIIHINTEIRLAWRQGMEKALAENSEEITPYKILPAAIEEIKKATERRMRLFGRILDK
ncbi:tagatose-bisphosphate aldolase [Candidatus Wolfebacteria bacterium CG02_land_8_20_14_3_00_37_12]|uniref:Tagatose-bisphosphate aldolase n=2 Tax=Candidatus Wolfeibacteriota TaxID=1752735 RepID=A0A2M7Q8K2_9BACT|nr:MAG: tagatose-bisphosphate aldolase [Candidatus Wolfebacteria bacterium CG02_land_8_20_14_3_00_37_12]PIY59756.1 MAG: tagatose-bisphosphate aldolase [Candidatus Wolfebacteria bacterium CG_4_10_14_0_8_um_filter_37_11]